MAMLGSDVKYALQVRNSVFANSASATFEQLASELILGVLSVLGVIAGFLLSVGWRLAFNKPNKYRSLLAPNAWFAICILFVLLGTWLAFKLLTTGQVVHLDAPAYSLALGIAAGVVGLRARRRASRGTNAA